MSAEHPTAAELIAQLKEKAAMSNREIADALGRDPSLVSQIVRGKKYGAHYVRALTELNRTGTITHRPERRRTPAVRRSDLAARAHSARRLLHPRRRARQHPPLLHGGRARGDRAGRLDGSRGCPRAAGAAVGGEEYQ